MNTENTVMKKCEAFIQAITPICLANGVEFAIIYGKHENDLSNANCLVMVADDDAIRRAYSTVAKAGIQLGMKGAINVRNKSDFPNRLKDMVKFVPSYHRDHILAFKPNNGRLEEIDFELERIAA